MFNNMREASLDGNGNIVIQNSDNSSITVNLEDAAGIRKLLVNLQHDISNLPLKIIQELMIHNNPLFPKRLEYGEPFSAYYNIADISLFKSLVEKDEDVTITAVVNTTLGEVYFSNQYKLKELIKDESHMRKGAFRGVLDLK